MERATPDIPLSHLQLPHAGKNSQPEKCGQIARATGGSRSEAVLTCNSRSSRWCKDAVTLVQIRAARQSLLLSGKFCARWQILLRSLRVWRGTHPEGQNTLACQVPHSKTGRRSRRSCDWLARLQPWYPAVDSCLVGLVRFSAASSRIEPIGLLGQRL